MTDIHNLRPDTPRQLYVAPEGDDGWHGSRQRPFAKLARAQQAVRDLTPDMRGDIVVNLRGGIPMYWTSRLTVRRDGRLRYERPPGDLSAHGYGTGKQEPVVLSGGRQIRQWTKDSEAGNIWRAEVGDLETRQLYVNERRAHRASINGQLPEFMFTDDGYVTANPEPLSWDNPGDIEFVYTGAAPWAEPRCGVNTIAAADDKTTIVMDQPSFRRAIGVFHSGVWPLRGPYRHRSRTAKASSPSPASSTSTAPRPVSVCCTTSPPWRGSAQRVGRRAGAGIVDPRHRNPNPPLRDITFRGLTFSHATWLHPNTAAGFVHLLGSHFENGDGIRRVVVVLMI